MTRRSDELWAAARGQDPAAQVDLARVERRLERTVEARRGRSRASWLALGGLLLGGAAVAAMVEVQARPPQAALEALEAPPPSAAPHQRRVLYLRRAEAPAPEPRAPEPRTASPEPRALAPEPAPPPREALVLHGPATTTAAAEAGGGEGVIDAAIDVLPGGGVTDAVEADAPDHGGEGTTPSAPVAPSLRAPRPTPRAPVAPAYAPRAVRERADDDAAP